jgi:hypothetical protein
MAVLVGLGILAACRAVPDADSRTISREVKGQVAAVKDATIPGGVTLLSSSGPRREGLSMSAEWAFELPTDWRAYVEQTDMSLRRVGYEPGRATADERVFSKHIPGDAYRVRLGLDRAGSKRVTVTFLAGPD